MPVRVPANWIVGFAVLAMSGTLSCGPSERETENVRVVAEPVVFGAPSGAGEDGVVLLAFEDESYCSGVLVGEGTVLTARHCVSELGEGIFACRAEGGLSLHQGSGGTFVRDRDANAIRVFVGAARPATGAVPAARGRRVVTDGAATICGHDMAVVLLDHALEGATPLQLRGSDMRVGESLRLIGWGVDESGMPVTNRRARDGLAVSRQGPAPEIAPHGSALTAGELEIGESACDGDSGGAIVDSNGALVGILSRGDGDRREARGPACFGTAAANVASVVHAHAALIAMALPPAGSGEPTSTACTAAPCAVTCGGAWAAVMAIAALMLSARRCPQRRRA